MLFSFPRPSGQRNVSKLAAMPWLLASALSLEVGRPSMLQEAQFVEDVAIKTVKEIGEQGNGEEQGYGWKFIRGRTHKHEPLYAGGRGHRQVLSNSNDMQYFQFFSIGGQTL